MNSRILDLISNPDLLAEADLPLLKEEISAQPFAQSLRALYLLGTKKYDADRFQKELSTTAAYTTDKKILYQLINGKIYEVSQPETTAEKVEKRTEEVCVPLETTAEENHLVEQTRLQQENRSAPVSTVQEGNWLAAVPKPPVPKKVITEGEVNRILFEGEENFLNEEVTEKIDLEATAETGVLVTEKINPEPAPEPLQSHFETATENILHEEKTPMLQNAELEPPDSQPEKKQSSAFSGETETNDAEVNFHREEAFMADMHLNPSSGMELPEPTVQHKTEMRSENKYEIERKKLAKEIEQKIALEKQFQPVTGTQDDQEMEVATGPSSAATLIQAYPPEPENTAINPANAESDEASDAISLHENPAFEKDLSAPGAEAENIGHSALDVSDDEDARVSTNEHQTTQEDVQQIETPTEKEITPMHISFFADDVSNLKKETELAEHAEKEILQSPESNVPTFINTWQKWLKIDRAITEAVLPVEAETATVKSVAIEKFLVTAPKISRFKEDGSYTVPEKKDDISHLMTETLAKLFWSQKLYSKAISGYKILIAKHPEKKEHYQNQIQEVQASRQK